MLALNTTAIAWIIFVVVLVGWITYYFLNSASARKELGSEIEMAPNRKPYYDDEVLEGRRLERVQLLGVLVLATMVIGLPVYWILEPGRQAGAGATARARGRAPRAGRLHDGAAAGRKGGQRQPGEGGDRRGADRGNHEDT